MLFTDEWRRYLMYKFEHTHQMRGEKLSEYIVRIDQILHQIILKKRVSTLKRQTKSGWTRPYKELGQTIPSCSYLLLKGTKEAPSYQELMGLVREEEAILDETNQEARLTARTF